MTSTVALLWDKIRHLDIYTYKHIYRVSAFVQFPPQAHATVHFCPALTHPQCFVHSFLQLHLLPGSPFTRFADILIRGFWMELVLAIFSFTWRGVISSIKSSSSASESVP